jgi:hypothetical protein
VPRDAIRSWISTTPSSLNPCSCRLKVLSYQVILICSVAGKKHELLRVEKVKAPERF